MTTTGTTTGTTIGTTIGTVGQPSRVTVTPWGGLVTKGDALEWYVAADDRWHRPSVEPTVRQRRIEGTPVVETRMRVPDGDAVQRAWCVPDHGGVTVVEFENDSPLPIAVAVAGAGSREGVLTSRPTADVPIEGIELPASAVVLPIGHRSTVRVGIPHHRDVDRSRVDLVRLPDAEAVVRGWQATTARASTLRLPDEALSSLVVERRCDLLLAGPCPPEDAVGLVLDAAELVRLGDEPVAWLVEAVPHLERAIRRARRDPLDPPADLVMAVRGALQIATTAEDARAVADLHRILDRIGPGEVPAVPLEVRSEIAQDASVGRFVRSVESQLACVTTVADEPVVELLANGMPSSWLGVDLDVHGLATRPGSTVSFAVRWHGERPAVLWEQTGDPCVLTSAACAPGWIADGRAGETLWPAPSTAPDRSASRPIVAR
jgi:hypothetical protein